MDRIHPSITADVARDILSARRALAAGTVIKTASDREKYWNLWREYATSCKIDPWLSNISQLEAEIIISGFAARIRSGSYGRGHQVTVSTVQDGLSAITKTFELAGQLSPIYQPGTTKYVTNIQRQIEGYRRDDPPVTPQLAVPVAVPNFVFDKGAASGNPFEAALGNLSLIAFYFMLRVGEYTQPKFVYRNKTKVRATRTKQFAVGDIGFFKKGKIVPRSSPLEVLLSCDSATMVITNQKNGKKGDPIHHEAIPNCEQCPIRALARQVHHILSHGGTASSLICTYYDDDGEERSIASRHIVHAIRDATRQLNLAERAINPNMVGSHSLRAGGSMAMKLNGLDDTKIQKYGRWRSATFLMYIHTQIGHLAQGVSQKMSTPLPFTNIAAIERS